MSKHTKLNLNRSKSKLQANFQISILVMSMLAAGLAATAFTPRSAEAQPPYPVPGAIVAATGTGNGEGFATSNSNGFYNITSFLDPGNYSVSASATGYVDGQVNNVPVTTGAETTNINVYLTVSGIIKGQITDAATLAPISAAYVFAQNASGGSQGFYAISANDGTYTINTNLPSGTYNVTALLVAGYISNKVTFVAVTAGATTNNVNIALSKSAIITGTVRDSATQALLSDIPVSAVSSTASFGGSAVTNSSGQYTINSDLPTGTYNVTVLYPTGHVPTTISGIAATAGQTTTVNINLNPSGIIRGTITATGTGTPINGAAITAFSSTGFFGTATTNASGNYQIGDGLGTDTYTIYVSSGTAFALVQNVNVVQGQTTSNVNAQLTVPPSGTITGTVTNSTGSPLSGVDITATGNLFNTATTTTDDTGFYMLAGLPPDTYSVNASTLGYNSQAKNAIAVVAGQVTANVNFQLSPQLSGRISGQVLTLTPAPQPSPSPTPTPTPVIPEIPASAAALPVLAVLAATATIAAILTRKKKRVSNHT